VLVLLSLVLLLIPPLLVLLPGNTVVVLVLVVLVMLAVFFAITTNAVVADAGLYPLEEACAFTRNVPGSEFPPILPRMWWIHVPFTVSNA
jgi:hypothetical protein